MKISIITATYNNRATLQTTIDSVLSQDYGNIEYIIVDGGSQDGTVEMVQSYENQVSQFVSEPDSGIYNALNKGIKMATGDVIGFMHSDDFFASNRVLSQVARAFEDNDVDAVYGDLHYVKADQPSQIVRNWISSAFKKSKLRLGWMPPHPSLYITRSKYEALGLYDESFRISADYDLILRYFGKGGIKSKYVPETFVKMRLGGASNGGLEALKKKMKEDLKALNKNKVGGVLTIFLKNVSKLNQFWS